MKIRVGFVSNSSTSSFLIVGTTNDVLVSKLMRAEGLDPEQCPSFGCVEGKFLNYYGDETVDCAGLDVEELLNQNNTVDYIKKVMIQRVKDELGIKIKPSDLQLMYGEAGLG